MSWELRLKPSLHSQYSLANVDSDLLGHATQAELPPTFLYVPGWHVTQLLPPCPGKQVQFSIEVLATGDVVFSGHDRHIEPAKNVPASQRMVGGEGVDSPIAGSGLVLGTGVLGAAVVPDVSGLVFCGIGAVVVVCCIVVETAFGQPS